MQLNHGDYRTPLSAIKPQCNMPSLLVMYYFECVNVLLLPRSRFSLARLHSNSSRFQPSGCCSEFYDQDLSVRNLKAWKTDFCYTIMF